MAEKKLSTEGFNKLEIELYRYGTLVFGKVIAQSESLRCDEDDELTHYDKGGYTIISNSSPDIADELTLCIRGSDKSEDNFKFHYNFDSVSEAAQFCSHIQRGIDVINGKIVDEDVPGVVSGLEKVI